MIFVFMFDFRKKNCSDLLVLAKGVLLWFYWIALKCMSTCYREKVYFIAISCHPAAKVKDAKVMIMLKYHFILAP